MVGRDSPLPAVGVMIEDGAHGVTRPTIPASGLARSIRGRRASNTGLERRGPQPKALCACTIHAPVGSEINVKIRRQRGAIHDLDERPAAIAAGDGDDNSCPVRFRKLAQGRPAAYIMGLMIPNAAPCGSARTAMRPTVGTSYGGM